MFNKKELLKWYDEEYCLNSVRHHSHNIKFVKKQTEVMCLLSVKQNGYNVRYINNPSEEVCMEAVKEDDNIIQFIDIIKYPRVWDYYVLSNV